MSNFFSFYYFQIEFSVNYSATAAAAPTSPKLQKYCLWQYLLVKIIFLTNFLKKFQEKITYSLTTCEEIIQSLFENNLIRVVFCWSKF